VLGLAVDSANERIATADSAGYIKVGWWWIWWWIMQSVHVHVDAK
jgi:hypothetical protein